MKGNRLLFGYALAYLAFLYVPVLVLPLFSLNNSAFIAFPLAGFTTRWYAGLADSALQHALVNSLKVGIAKEALFVVKAGQCPIGNPRGLQGRLGHGR